ncbi:MAG: CBS domain-containing protein [Nitrosopumilus sp.]|nr:CBS domain-containing protein [Nitrosopumilus sp.]MDH3490093.1 CBS domain-containing protein [Nitrosopumilus sp.]MDH3517280.1 CBS domain-containing protein [Nitrosopumilus sp.]MDH3565134.1 CBS domain-containing protein [Nitrosopumilus sp.]MDH5416903.1 CBS domain-containing protein [Nitrosopumilus sp.]
MVEDSPVAEKSLEELLPETLDYSLCITIEKGKEVWVVSGMLVQYLESVTDSVVVKDGEKMIGVIGGKEIMENILKNPSRDLFYGTKVEDIMEKNPVLVSNQTKYKDLMSKWKERGRAFAILKNRWNHYSAISAKKILEIGMRCKTNLSILDIPKKPAVTYKPDEPLGKIINSMFENKTRKILLEDSYKYINDRIIIETISEKMKYLKDIDNFLDIPANTIEPEEARVIFSDLKINEVSAMMYDMEHPYVIYKDWIVTPWDICNVLLSKEITKYNV